MIGTRVSFKETKNMETEFVTLRVAPDLKENSKMDSSMEQVIYILLMAVDMKESGKTER